MTSAIAIERICMEFGTPGQGLKALDDVSLDIHANEFFTLLGPSGCGKTTLLRLIAGFEQPSSGSIRLYGEHMEGLPPFRRPVNTVFQSYALFPHMSVADNIGFGLEMQGPPAQRDRRHREPHARPGEAAGGRQAPRRPVVRWPATTHRPGPRAGQPAQGAAARRVAVGAGPEAAQGNADRAEAPAARDRDHLHLRHPRPGGSADHVRPHRGDEQGQGVAGRHAQRHLRGAAEPGGRRLHRRNQLPRGPGRRRRRAPGGRPAAGRDDPGQRRCDLGDPPGAHRTGRRRPVGRRAGKHRLCRHRYRLPPERGRTAGLPRAPAEPRRRTLPAQSGAKVRVRIPAAAIRVLAE